MNKLLNISGNYLHIGCQIGKPFSNLHELAYLSLFIKKILVYWLEHLQNFHLKFYFRGEESHSSANKCMLKVIDDQDVTFEACDWSISICPDQESQCLWHLVSLYFRWPSTLPRWRTTRRPSRFTSKWPPPPLRTSFLSMLPRTSFSEHQYVTFVLTLSTLNML